MQVEKASDKPSTPAVVTPDQPGESLADIDGAVVAALFKEHGALLFRGFGVDTEGFEGFARRQAPVAVFNASDKRDDVGDAVQTVNLGHREFPLHAELARTPWRPDVAFFFCRQPPPRDGQTTVCDTVELVRRLPAEVRQAFEGRHFQYREKAGLQSLQYWMEADEPNAARLASPPGACPFRFEVDGGWVYRSFDTPAFYKPPFGDEPAFGNFLLFARYMLGVDTFPLFEDGTKIPDDLVAAVKKASDELTVPVEWQAGDLLMVDNWRFMHGRRECDPSLPRDIVTYFGYLPSDRVAHFAPVDRPWRRLDSGEVWKPRGEGDARFASARDLGQDASGDGKPPETPRIDPENIARNAGLYLFSIEPPKAVFLPMDRDHFHRSIFLDRRIKRPVDAVAELSLDEVIRASRFAGHAPGPLGMIFHMAHCGSTLLARALDIPGRIMVYREPRPLRQVGLMAARFGLEDALDDATEAALELALGQVRKRFAGESHVVVKANVPVNVVLPSILRLCPDLRGTILYLSLPDYMMSILKSEHNVRWIGDILKEMGIVLCQLAGVEPERVSHMSAAEATAVIWLAQIRRFLGVLDRSDALRTLNAEIFFRRPETVLLGVNEHLGLGLPEVEIGEIAQSELFTRHAKDPRRVYDDEARRAELAARRADLSESLAAGLSLVKDLTSSVPLPDDMPADILGASHRLLESPPA